MQDYSHLPLVNISEMEDGDVAIMENNRYKGRLVQRHNLDLISINAPYVNRWSGIFGYESSLECRIILKCNKK